MKLSTIENISDACGFRNILTNCRIDINMVIKVADFGLSESVGTKEYFRQDKDSAVKLPIKWLAPESMEDYVFSEKSDGVKDCFDL